MPHPVDLYMYMYVRFSELLAWCEIRWQSERIEGILLAIRYMMQLRAPEYAHLFADVVHEPKKHEHFTAKDILNLPANVEHLVGQLVLMFAEEEELIWIRPVPPPVRRMTFDPNCVEIYSQEHIEEIGKRVRDFHELDAFHRRARDYTLSPAQIAAWSDYRALLVGVITTEIRVFLHNMPDLCKHVHVENVEEPEVSATDESEPSDESDDQAPASDDPVAVTGSDESAGGSDL